MRISVRGILSAAALAALAATDAGGASARVDAIVEAVAKLSPSVVNVSTDRIAVDPFFERFFQNLPEEFAPTRRVRTAGSGVIFAEEGYVLTNFHVVGDAVKIQVRLMDGRDVDARLIAGDARKDLAVLAIESGEKFAAAPFARSDDLYVGETVIAMGNPFGLTNTVSRGVLSAVGREVRAGGSLVFHNLLQTDAAINPGNSGGPLADVDAEVIGINTVMQAGAENIGFAIPIGSVKDFLLEVGADTGSLSSASGLRARREGGTEAVVVESVAPGSGAERAGFKAGDVLRRVGSREIRKAQDYFAAFVSIASGTRVDVTVLRDGKERTLALAIEAFDPAAVVQAKLGLAIRSLDGRTNTPYDETRLTGVLVVRTAGGSAAERAGIRPGDAVVTADGRKLASAADLAGRVTGKGSGEVVNLEVLRLVRSGRGSIVIRSVKLDVPVQ
ncbi:MAG: trypsin-like peptidase domain-containing protein [Planctomycetota bacterium]